MYPVQVRLYCFYFALTVGIEAAIFAFLGKRQGECGILCARLNAVTNFIMNLIAGFGQAAELITFPAVLLLEAAIVCIGHIVYAL